MNSLNSFTVEKEKNIFLRLGHTNDVMTGEEFGTKLHKNELVKADLQNAFGTHLEMYEDKTCLLIDEVQSGSTIASAAFALSEELFELGITDSLFVVGAEDNRVYRDKTRYYCDIMNGKSPNIQMSSIPLPLFFIDREELLYFQLAPGRTNGTNKTKEEQLLLSHVMQNTPSHELFRNLAKAYLNPDWLKKALNIVYSNQKPNESSDPDYQNVSQLYFWLQTILNNNGNYERKAPNQKIHHWLRDFCTLSS